LKQESSNLNVIYLSPCWIPANKVGNPDPSSFREHLLWIIGDRLTALAFDFLAFGLVFHRHWRGVDQRAIEFETQAPLFLGRR
jgi:hypothetical protein